MSKITAYSAISSVQPDDLLLVVDVHDTSMAASGTDKKMTLAQLGATGALNVRNTAYAGGADPSGSAACDAAFAALNTALPATGAVIVLPPGNFKLNATWVLPSTPAGITIVGAGRGATTITAASGFTAGTPLIQVAAPGSGYRHDFVIQDLTLNTAAAGLYGLQLDSTYYAVIQRVDIEGGWARSIYLNGSGSFFGAYTSIRDCHLGPTAGGAGSGSTGTGIYSNNSEHWSVSDCTFDWFNGAGGTAIYVQNSDVRISGCHFDECDTSIVLWFCQQTTIHHNFFDRGLTQFLKMQGCKGCQFINNSLNTFAGTGSKYMIVPTSDGGRQGNLLTGNRVLAGTSWAGLVSQAGGSATDPDIYRDNNLEGLALGTFTSTSVWDTVTAPGAGFNVLNPAYAGGADPTGSADSAPAFAAAIAALPAGGGVITVPPGSYKLASGITFNQNQGMTCPGGSAATSFTYTGSGTAITITISGSFTGGEYAGKFSGFHLSGYTAGGSAVGIQAGNLQGLDMTDVAIYGFGGKGLYYLHGTGWAEESTVRARIVQCGTYGTSTSGAVVFDGTSFDYGDYDFTIVTSPGVHGIVLQNGAQLRGARLRVRGNFYARTTANTGVVIAIAPAGGSDTSYITDTLFDVAVEVAGTTGQIGHTFVLLGSTNAASQLTGSGVLSFNPFGSANIYSQGFSNANFLPFGFSGYIQDGTATGPPYAGDGLTVQGGVAYAPNGHLNSRPGGGNDVYFTFGPICEGQLASGNNTLVFHGGGSGSYLRMVELWLAQPSSGSAGTVTWPSGTKWPGGTPPTLSSTNGYVDKLRFTFLAEGNWYGELAGTHYA